MPGTVLGVEQDFNKCLPSLMEPFLKVLKLIMASVHFVHLPLSILKGHMKFSTLFQIHDHFAHSVSLVRGVCYCRGPVRRHVSVVEFPKCCRSLRR